jgi:hypothetical protein
LTNHSAPKDDYTSFATAATTDLSDLADLPGEPLQESSPLGPARDNGPVTFNDGSDDEEDNDRDRDTDHGDSEEVCSFRNQFDVYLEKQQRQEATLLLLDFLLICLFCFVLFCFVIFFQISLSAIHEFIATIISQWLSIG